jgi:hypothetical protein
MRMMHVYKDVFPVEKILFIKQEHFNKKDICFQKHNTSVLKYQLLFLCNILLK